MSSTRYPAYLSLSGGTLTGALTINAGTSADVTALTLNAGTATGLVRQYFKNSTASKTLELDADFSSGTENLLIQSSTHALAQFFEAGNITLGFYLANTISVGSGLVDITNGQLAIKRAVTDALPIKMVANSTISALTIGMWNNAAGDNHIFNIRADFNVGAEGTWRVHTSHNTGDAGIISLDAATSTVTIGDASNLGVHTLNTTLATNGAQVGTLTNLPTAVSGNPTGFIVIKVNGTNRNIPFW